MQTRGDYLAELLHLYRWERTEHRVRAFAAWMQAEGNGGRFNPMNTTHTMPGSTDFNSVGVQNYVSLKQGAEAFKITLGYGAEHHLYGYDKIFHRLAVNASAGNILDAVAASSWGTGEGALHVLREDMPEQLKATLQTEVVQ